uniref:C-type lectin domain-containing protein n=1 Tax=Stegastes partitus TaxID=144197 RepID=A0A3B5BG28_9TELE
MMDTMYKDQGTDNQTIQGSELRRGNRNMDIMISNIPCLIFFPPEKTCPAGWSMFTSTCYLLSQESGSWDEGRKDCKGQGADLVVINSPEEQTFLSMFKRGHTWIGLNDKEKEGTWTWVDGTPLTLSYWRNNQPDNGGGHPQLGEEDCAHFRHEIGYWNDISCTTSLQWICEKQP